MKIEVSDCEFQAGQPQVTWTEIEAHGRHLLKQYFDFGKKYKEYTQVGPVPEISDADNTKQYLTNLCIYLKKLKDFEPLLKYSREIFKVTEGSIITHISVPTIQSLEDLWKMYNTNQLADIFTALLEDKLVERFVLSTLELKVTLLEQEYSQIKQQFSKQASKGKTVGPQLPVQLSDNSGTPTIVSFRKQNFTKLLPRMKVKRPMKPATAQQTSLKQRQLL